MDASHRIDPGGIRRRVCYLLAPLLLSGALGLGQTLEQIDQAKEGLVYLESRAGSGAAYCVSKDGYFLTGARMVSGQKPGDTVELTHRKGRITRRGKAEVIRIDFDLNLALIRGAARGTPLPLGSSHDLNDDEEIRIIGFPEQEETELGKLNLTPKVTVGRVMRRVRIDGKRDPIYFLGETTKGDLGGPVLNANGELVGVMVSNSPRTKIAVGSERLNKFLLRAEGEFKLPELIPYARRSEPVAIGFDYSYAVALAEKPSVRAWFVGVAGDKRELKVEAGEEGYVLTGVPVVEGSAEVTKLVRGDFYDSSGRVDRRVEWRMDLLDGPLKVGGVSLLLSEISFIVSKKEIVRTWDGRELQGKIEGLDSVRKSNGEGVPVQFFERDRIVGLRPLQRGVERITCRVEVVAGGRTSTFEAHVPIEDRPRHVDASGDPTIPHFRYDVKGEGFAGGEKEIAVGEIHDLAWGGGGRYLVVHLREEKRLAVIDCHWGVPVGSVPVPAGQVVFGAGARELLVADGGTVTRWQLDPVKKLGPPVVWTPGRILGFSCGLGATQMVGVRSDAAEEGGLIRFELRKWRTGETVAIEPAQRGIEEWVHGAASFDGSVYGLYSALDSGQGALFVVEGGAMRAERHKDGAWIMPGVDGSTFYTGRGVVGIRGYPNLKVSAWRSYLVLPSTVQDLGCGIVRPYEHDSSKRATLSVIDVRSNRVLLRDYVAMPELRPAKPESDFEEHVVDLVAWNKRCQFSPQLGLVSTVALTNDKVVVRRVDLWKALRDRGERFLYTTGTLPRHLSSGQEFTAKLETESSGGKSPTFTLVEGPAGLVVSPAGEFKWSVPAEAAGLSHRVLVRIGNADGVERLWDHRFFVH